MSGTCSPMKNPTDHKLQSFMRDRDPPQMLLGDELTASAVKESSTS